MENIFLACFAFGALFTLASVVLGFAGHGAAHLGHGAAHLGHGGAHVGHGARLATAPQWRARGGQRRPRPSVAPSTLGICTRTRMSDTPTRRCHC